MNKLRYTILFLFCLGTQFSWGQCAADEVDVFITHPDQFTGESISVIGNDIYTPVTLAGAWNYSINFGNGTVETGTGTGLVRFIESEIYTIPGFYTITTTIMDDTEGCSYTEINTINITTAVGECAAPEFIGSLLNSPCLDTPTSLSINIDSPAGVLYTLVEVVWDLGNGTLISTATPTLDYTYDEEGIYDVTALVTVSDGVNLCTRYAESTNSISGTSYATAFKRIIVFDGHPEFSMSPDPVSPGDVVTFTYEGTPFLAPWMVDYWNYEFLLDGVVVNVETYPGADMAPGDILYVSPPLSTGTYTAELRMKYRAQCPQSDSIVFNVQEEPCDTCNSFRPLLGERYWMSAWVKVDEPTQVKSYNPLNLDNGTNLLPASLDDVYIEMELFGSGTTVQFFPTDNIIDGWQRVVGEFTIPFGTYDLGVNLYADEDHDTFFDDIRIHPFNGSMKSYVYDGETFWLTSELDDNNYATFYEYDQEGGLVRIKKETARGIVTIQETRSGTVKK